ncbi:Uncharacterised protein [Serratia quinivorans]|nr:hypothetical protein [Serratia quinivorans]CAI1575368.1 Uncharacterised protein [Serratia quinivorans]
MDIDIHFKLEGVGGGNKRIGAYIIQALFDKAIQVILKYDELN